MKTTLTSMVILLTAACATPFAELRQGPPVRSASLPGSYLQLATCSLEAFESGEARYVNGFVYRLVDRHPGHEAAVTGIAGGDRMIDFLFRQQDGGAVIVESRTASGVPFYSYLARKAEERSWSLIERCADKSAEGERR